LKRRAFCRQRSLDTDQLAIFDIDGTLTDTNAVDDECYARAVAEALDLDRHTVDWSDTPHVTDGAIARCLWTRHRGRPPDPRDLAELQRRFLAILHEELTLAPERFVPIEGATTIAPRLQSAGWCVALATGAWHESAAVKLRAAGLVASELAMACADEAESREDIVRLAWRKAEVQAGTQFHRVVSVGDAPWDVRTARSLGLPFVGIATGAFETRLRAAGAATVLPHLGDGSAVLAALSSASVPGSSPSSTGAPA
jgi:phosphoglycolate phosphatase-like HAD superfamily hydrolase